MNTQLEAAVQATLSLDPRIPDPVGIAVSGDGGIVTLRGTVGSFKQRRAAVEDARKVEGVYEVDDELQVRFHDVAMIFGVGGITNNIKVISPGLS
jgi:osmotically-inducible protein OsmY